MYEVTGVSNQLCDQIHYSFKCYQRQGSKLHSGNMNDLWGQLSQSLLSEENRQLSVYVDETDYVTLVFVRVKEA